jgi:hypothetical protein
MNQKLKKCSSSELLKEVEQKPEKLINSLTPEEQAQVNEFLTRHGLKKKTMSNLQRNNYHQLTMNQELRKNGC